MLTLQIKVVVTVNRSNVRLTYRSNLYIFKVEIYAPVPRTSWMDGSEHNIDSDVLVYWSNQSIYFILKERFTHLSANFADESDRGKQPIQC